MSIYIFILIFITFHFIKELFPTSRFLIYSLSLFSSLIYFSLIKMDLSMFIIISLLIYSTFIIQKNLNYYIFPLFITIPLTLAIKTEFKNLMFYQLALYFSTLFIFKFYKKNKIQNIITKELLLKKSKELSVIRKTSLMFQKTLDYDELIEILLKTLTSVEGLNFDRAIIFLFDERMNEFIPYYLKDKNFKKRILLNSGETPTEYLDLQFLKVKNSIINPFGKAFDTKEPIVIENIDNSDSVQNILFKTLGTTSFGLLPLIEKNHIKGVVFVDNYNTKTIITNEELDNSVSIIHQASTALINSNLYKQSQNLAYTDSLTGLFNKRYLDFSFEQNLGKLLSKEFDLAALIIDVDYFKNYNDTNGHIAGNTALKRIAELLLTESRNKDVVVRFGGEEFCILLFDIDKDGALGVAERMRNRVEKEAFFNETLQPNKNLSISIGLSMFNGENTLELFLEKADKALYEAKNRGRNKVIYYNGENYV